MSLKIENWIIIVSLFAIFSIHGNHDDPCGLGGFCSLDNLHTAGLINYFGRQNSLKEIVVSPLLFQKGETKLALYGMSSVKDEIEKYVKAVWSMWKTSVQSVKVDMCDECDRLEWKVCKSSVKRVKDMWDECQTLVRKSTMKYAKN